jgi:hypothetical protein
MATTEPGSGLCPDHGFQGHALVRSSSPTGAEHRQTIAHGTAVGLRPTRKQAPAGATERPPHRCPDLPPPCRGSPPRRPAPTRNPPSHDLLPILPLRVFASSRETVGCPPHEDGRKNHKKSQWGTLPLGGPPHPAIKSRRPPFPEARLRSPRRDGASPRRLERRSASAPVRNRAATLKCRFYGTDPIAQPSLSFQGSPSG